MIMLLLAIPLTGFLVYLLIAAIVFAIAAWIINSLVPEPARRWAFIVLVVIAAIVLIKILLGATGTGEPTL
jgi:quinol-cytochrome oxidoreductase complex cytochrome b subunit